MGGGLDLNKFLRKLQAFPKQKALAAKAHSLPVDFSLKSLQKNQPTGQFSTALS
jgi:hypothetical protein